MPAAKVIGLNPLPEPDMADDEDSFVKVREQMVATLLMAKKQAALRKYTPLKRGSNNILVPHLDPIVKKARNDEDDNNRENMVVEMVKDDFGQNSFLKEREDTAAALLAAKKKVKSSKTGKDKGVYHIEVKSVIPTAGGNEEKKEIAETLKDDLGQDPFLREREEMAAVLLAAKKKVKSGKRGVDKGVCHIEVEFAIQTVGGKEEKKGSTENESVKSVMDLNPSCTDSLMEHNSKAVAIERTYRGGGNSSGIENVNRHESYARPIRIRLTKEFPASDIRKMLVERARIDLGFKLETLKNIVYEDNSVLDVPDPEFHDFDMDRTHHTFQKEQVWACYDDDDGMPRFYAFVKKKLSSKKFKIRFSYLKSPSTAEFGRLSWIGSGFVKTLGHFRLEEKCEIARAENLFSHKVDWERGPRGTIRIFPRCGEVWALYKNWSADWDPMTPDEVIHEYEMVEVLDEYRKDKRCCVVVPLVKVNGFTAVFKRTENELGAAKRTVKREEMLRFSHRVPAFKLDGVQVKNDGPVLDGCYELDPAALPVGLVQGKETGS
jgi:Domain of unknown function (DUF3444)